MTSKLPITATLSNPEVNSGNTFNLNLNNLKTSWEMYTNTNGNPRQSIGADYTEDISKGNNQGFNNPEHSLSGHIKLNETHQTGANAQIDVEWIELLILNCDQVLTLSSDKFKTTSNLDGEIKVMLKNYTSSLPYSNIMTYTMTLIEVKTD